MVLKKDEYFKLLTEAQIRPKDMKSITDLDIPRKVVDWTYSINITSLDNIKVDFARDFDIVECFREYRQQIQKNLQKHLLQQFQAYRDGQGALAHIGSCWDGSKIGRMNEMDCLFVMDVPGLTINKQPHLSGEYQVLISGKQLKPRNFNVLFANCLEKAVLETPLPSSIQHGGYAKPEFSGLRFNGPASTALFSYRPNTDPEFPLSLDVTPAFPLPSEFAERLQLIEHIRSIIQENKGTQTIINGPHVVPDILNDTWKLSTAQVEAEILKDVLKVCPPRLALARSKALFHHLEKLNTDLSVFNTPAKEGQPRIVTDLRHYMATTDQRKRQNLREDLNARMRYEHIQIPPRQRLEFHETSKNGLAINTAAVKHIILAYALDVKGAFSVRHDLVSQDMMHAVLVHLSDPVSPFIKHAFLDTTICKYSVLPCMANLKQRMIATIRKECDLLARNAVTKVSARQCSSKQLPCSHIHIKGVFKSPVTGLTCRLSA